MSNLDTLQTILNNDIVAKWINISDYAYDTLSANADIKAIMDAADKYGYGEWVETNGEWGPKGNVPIMTSNTAPYGTLLYSGNYSGYMPYAPFDGNSDKVWYANSTSNGYVGYKFVAPVKVRRVKLIPGYLSGYCTVKNYRIEASYDGNDWVSIYAGNISENKDYINDPVIIDIPDSTADFYLYYRLYIVDTLGTTNTNVGARFLQFYGRELKILAPAMTNESLPYGQAFSNGSYYSASSNRAFTRNTDSWTGATGRENVFIGYKSIRPMVLKQVWTQMYVNLSSGHSYLPTITYILEASNNSTNGIDGTWYEIATLQRDLSPSVHRISCAEVDNSAPYLCYRIRFPQKIFNDGSYAYIDHLYFNGLDYSEKDWDSDMPRHYIYDHGVEPNETVTLTGSATKESDNIKLAAANSQASVTINTSDYTSMGSMIGEYGSGTNQMIAGSASSKYSSTNMPDGNGIDISNVNDSNTVGIKQTVAGIITIKEMWVA